MGLPDIRYTPSFITNVGLSEFRSVCSTKRMGPKRFLRGSHYYITSNILEYVLLPCIHTYSYSQSHPSRYKCMHVVVLIHYSHPVSVYLYVYTII